VKRFSTSFIVGLLIGLLLLASAAFAGNPVKLFVNGQEIQPDVPPQIIDGRVMVPARFVAEPLGARVEWFGATSTVYITTPQEAFTPVEAPQITGPDNFVKVIQGALKLGQEKDLLAYAWIASNLKEIKFETNPAPGFETSGAYINKETKTCYVVSDHFNDVISESSISEASLLYLGVLAHETSHICLKEAGFEYVLNEDDEEVVCNLAGLRVMEKAGGTNSDKPVWFFKELIKKDLKL